MSKNPPCQGAPGCPCEDCLSARIELSAALAVARDVSLLRRRLDGTRLSAEEIAASAS
jgi:hypothetical protein